MKTRIFTILGLIGLLFFMQSCCTPGIIGSVNNVLHPQQTNNWCWAATTQMIAQNEGIIVSQCDLANHRFGKTNCCNDQPNDSSCRKTNDCDESGWPELDFAGLKFTETATAISWNELKKAIYCSKDVLGYAYGQPEVIGHVVVIKGYVSVGATNYVVINDPWAPCDGEERLLEYNEYVDPTGPTSHWSTMYKISKK